MKSKKKLAFLVHPLLKPATAVMLSLTLLGSSFAVAQTTASPVVNFWGNYNIPGLHTDPSKPQTGRSYLTTKVEEVPGGVKLIIDLWNGKINEPVAIYLQAAINDGSGKMETIPFITLSANVESETVQDYVRDANGQYVKNALGGYEMKTVTRQKLVGVKDNPTDYHSRREFTLSYAELNAKLKAALPANAQHIDIVPGTPLFVLGNWTDYGHFWGGIARGGIIYLPETAGTQSAQVTGSRGSPTDLDIGYPIQSQMAMLYNHVDANGKSTGLKVGGQVKSRLESEGKYQISLDESANVTKRLFHLANTPTEAAKVLGNEWTIEAEMKYMKKDNAGAYLKDEHGLPVPDPMVDTYYDTVDNLGAKNDISIRYRWTEGNGEGAWNLKPGFANPSAEGVVRRIEYGVETTDDKPETVKKFADSMDPLNPFKYIRDIIPGATPSNFLHPSVKITDTRYKFKLKHKNGLIIEISVDNVHATSLRMPGHEARYTQMEMDVDHPSAQSANVAQAANTVGAFATSTSSMSAQINQFLTSLGAKAFLDGRPVIHTTKDLELTSQLSQKIAPDLAMADLITKEVRNEVSDRNWIQGPQKYSLAAVLVGHVDKKEASGSVKAMNKRIEDLRNSNLVPKRMFEQGRPGLMCKEIKLN